MIFSEFDCNRVNANIKSDCSRNMLSFLRSTYLSFATAKDGYFTALQKTKLSQFDQRHKNIVF